ncbi:hypothetical protein ES708_11780 [subsurface metagenome]
MKGYLHNIFRSINRKFFHIKWYDLRQTSPVSNVFGLDRGLPVDRFYIERFLEENRRLIKGAVLEIGDDCYSRKFGSGIVSQEILHFTDGNPKAMLTGDLANLDTLKPGIADCFICTQTLNFIYDVQAAVKGIHYMLRENGVALVTVAGISQISRYDMDRWGDYWRFTDRSVRQLFSDVFKPENIDIGYFGNVLASIAFLEGISADELSADELLFTDENYQLILTVKAVKS